MINATARKPFKKQTTEVKTAGLKKKITEIIYLFVFVWTNLFRNEPLAHSKHRHIIKKKTKNTRNLKRKCTKTKLNS